MPLNTLLEVLNIPKNLTIDEILDMLIIYLRKSRKDMDYYKDESIEKTLQRHEKELQEHIINILGKPIPEHNIYREVVSGDTIEDRPVMQEVLSTIENENKKAVVCIEIERLARGNTMDQGIIAQTFLYTNTKIITPHKIYNLDNEDDLSYFEEGLYQARKYLMYTKRILKRGRIRSVKEGKYIGSITPYGYDKQKLPNEKGYILIFNEKEKAVVELIADLFLNGLKTTYEIKKEDTISTIAKTFGTHKKVIISNNEHISNDIFKPGKTINIIINDMRATNISHYLNYLKIECRKSKIWTANMIRNILQSEAIYGRLTWDKRKVIKTIVNGKVIKTSPKNNNYLSVKGKHKAILSEETERKIKEKFKRNSVKTIPDNKELKNPLVGLVTCSFCGYNMTRRPYSERKNIKPRKKRVFDIDKEKLRLFLRENKGNHSLNEIAKSLQITRDIAAHWFATNSNNFTIPPADKWYDLKKLLNIEKTEFDQALTTLEEVIPIIHEETLICSKPRCKCVGSNLKLVEDKIINSLKTIHDEFVTYIENYEEEIIKKQNNNNALVNTINREIEKVKTQLEKTCEFLETGLYSQELFISRSNILNEQLESLKKQKIEISKINNNEEELYQKKKAIPVIENILNNYNNDLSPEEKNALLSSIIQNIIYHKEKGGRYLKDNFKLSINLVRF